MNQLFKQLCLASFRINTSHNLHTSAPAKAWTKSDLPKSFLKYNKKIYPPQDPSEEPRPKHSRTYC